MPEHAGTNVSRRALHAVQPEVAQRHAAVEAHADVLRAKVGAHQAGRMHVLERRAHFDADSQRLGDRQAPLPLPRAAQQLAEIRAPDVLDDDAVCAVELRDVEKLHQVRVPRLGDDLQLVQEHPNELGVVLQVLQQPLHHDEAAARFAREPRLHQAARREPADQRVGTIAHRALMLPLRAGT